MVTPISNDKILPSDSARTTVSDKKTAEQGGANKSDMAASTSTSDETNNIEVNSVDVERANQIYSQSQTKTASGESTISTPEQARLVAADLRGQIEENGLQALQAQAGPASANLSALLETAPT